ncbi:hypothetical protein [Burkholderia sp. SCN-KJ]|uniref:hypothetical protein n=1 Tax=Burkholderia sp. SCN-KJ TaxID=2969248 RepID=UPI0021503866|nr:hypothetical protein [Burkholderia sp. SCN-KJ]MCR4470020.1 hypothetical protein [Burkholderia sp. SCN-KJ]
MTDELRGKEIFIDLGAHALVPDVDGIELIRCYNNSTRFRSGSTLGASGDHRQKLYCAGTRAIFLRFGSNLTVFARGEGLPNRQDGDGSQAPQEVLTRAGARFIVSAESSSFEPFAAGGGRVGIAFADLMRAALDATRMRSATSLRRSGPVRCRNHGQL